MHVITKRSATDSGFEQKQEEKRFQHTILRKETGDIGERACDIVRVNSKELTAERTGEGIKQAGVSAYEAAQCFKEPYVLSIEIQYQYRFISKGMDSAREIYQIHQNGGNEHAEQKVSVRAQTKARLFFVQKLCGGFLFFL